MSAKSSLWANRFLAAAIVQGALVTGLTAYVVIGQLWFLRPEVSRVIAAGGAGNWFTMGYLSYLIVGVIGAAVTSLFYYYIEVTLNKPYTGTLNTLAGLHLILMNVGIIGATWMMMIGGYLGGAAMLPKAVGGGGLTAAEVHDKVFYAIPGGYPLWISIFLIVLGAGVLLGGLGYVLAWRRKTA
ncbi:MAG: hypothetical protein NZ920_01600 [Aigarchaeota archaeon]|nr:hypothetical protein [Aigarchaeota archaeon]MDW8093137.1 hypothetical protein [Nitrososphaerota archaeon]